MYVYQPCVSIFKAKDSGHGATLALGDRRAASTWRILQVEILVTRDVLVTLKAQSAFGVLPELDLQDLDVADRAQVTQAIERVVEAAYRESPISVIDQCRNAAAVVVSRWLRLNGAHDSVLERDLSAVAAEAGKPGFGRSCVEWQCRTIARLHPRGKDNERLSKDLRQPIQEDAELAIHALGFVLRELGWMKR
jgi:hypothetical protein